MAAQQKSGNWKRVYASILARQAPLQCGQDLEAGEPQVTEGFVLI
jgi:hypothetical protein